jgi:hypothetical protein
VTKQHIHRLSIHPKGDPLPMYCQSLDCTQEFTEERLSEAVNDAAVLGMIAEMAREYVSVEIYWMNNTYFDCILRTIPEVLSLEDTIHSEGKGATLAAAVRACWQAWKEGSK